MDDMTECQHNFIASFYIRIKLIRVCNWQWQNLCNLLAAVLGERKSLKQTLNQMGYWHKASHNKSNGNGSIELVSKYSVPQWKAETPTQKTVNLHINLAVKIDTWTQLCEFTMRFRNVHHYRFNLKTDSSLRNDYFIIPGPCIWLL